MLETIGDLHLFVFKHKVMNYGLICNRGLFKVMRHPNYVGSTFWMTGLALACWNGCNGKGWIPLICSFTFCIGTNFLTGIPPAERALHSHYGNEIQYHLYVSATSIFIPVVPVIEHTMQWIRRRPQNIPPPAEAAAHPISPSLSSTSPILTPTHLQAERDLQNSPPSLFDSSSYSPAPPADVSTPPEINISPSYFRPHDSMHRPNEMKYPPSNNEDQKQDPFENKFQKQDGAGLSLLNP
ncbi:putative Protein of unknown function (DUF1295) [Monocercomonoides exilis]|uniref:putative Protein of unknown function (DUF1295) n=1 Tax=Monocercomonoides exilis TaxID=2049356 RepID=UPI003559D716|nr:putative Protein of unknown function (DUF1295) [Monocercomonoides exilis]|eukprot:MONOS_13053.1-p1 / transcript=MONOS_13053.1 / gene=MONOS_13053 / organism=Monocercomonoides_exilis_PA203 / gene_product=unspecified product / transcript_product=unspecified product / location=Mono_scaffold00772:8041-8757(-) / protein_length=238 / sequence_SO=supercontig / SO=protein_coding / is_pseudo=false